MRSASTTPAHPDRPHRSAPPGAAVAGGQRTRAKRLPAAERRASLLATAAELLETGGSDALRMDALARAAGVTRPVVYEHFGDREGLLVAVIEEYGLRLQARVGAAVAGKEDLDEELRAAVRAYLAGVREQGAALRSLLRAGGPSPAVEAVRTGIWESAIRRWAARYRQEVDISQPDAEALAAFHLHGLWSLSDRWLAGKLSARRVEQLHLAVVAGSLREVAERGRTRPQG